MRRQSSLFIPGRRRGKRKNTKTLNTRTLYGKGNARNGWKGGPAGVPGCASGAAIECFLRLEVVGDALGALFLPVRCSVNRTTMFWPNGDISIT